MIFNPVEFLRIRRFDLREHTDDEIEEFLKSYLQQEIPDYQMAAWLMAVCCQGLSARETATLTRCMVESGEQLVWKDKTTYRVDKHSTGGVGDKISIVLAPLVASLGLQVPMMAGRGLGHTGGTIDKLESIPGFRTDWSVADFQRICQETGCIINTTGPTLCPADAKLYALRDVTGTVWSIPLITGSIMSKKIAERPDSLVLDVKYGVGAFSPSREAAQELAESLVATGEANGLTPTTAFLTRMEQPIGWAVGNWLEVHECIQLLKGWQKDEDIRKSRDLIDLIVHQAGQMLRHQDPKQSLADCVQKAYTQLKSGGAYAKWVEMVQAQGGDVEAAVDNCDTFMATNATNTATFELKARNAGFVVDINAMTIGLVGVDLGAGRKQAGTSVDPWAGMSFSVKMGDRVEVGDVLVTVFHDKNLAGALECYERIYEAFEISSEPVAELPPIITHMVTKDGCQEMNMVPYS
eukprot:CAMPEP_0113603530 /NCGR_PEP_ID=MMETSP0017_2-20120614/1326_1 /TAXON_ID=2856 /ORGANISM="Cylindrotheca closterium" /LENGTH=465 /DNA_ID=CAMNT_0000511925 /DNA_START=1 /DNA_END=1398 /DNA_ORIENTATION=+ /assembly_acc=CAM_ASM_000147